MHKRQAELLHTKVQDINIKTFNFVGVRHAMQITAFHARNIVEINQKLIFLSL